jgi:hypothetical protein
MTPEVPARHVRALAGKHRIPDIVRTVDGLARGRAPAPRLCSAVNDEPPCHRLGTDKAEGLPICPIMLTACHCDAVRVDVPRKRRAAIAASTCKYLDEC